LPLSQPQRRHIPPKRYVPFTLTWFTLIWIKGIKV
jgi:hypothetical protein